MKLSFGQIHTSQNSRGNTGTNCNNPEVGEIMRKNII